MNERSGQPMYDVYYCGLCTRPGPRNIFAIVDDERGFVDYHKCKDERRCAEHMATVDWEKVQAEART